MEIRHIQESDDRLKISRIYEESWKYAYQGIVPQDYLDSISGRPYPFIFCRNIWAGDMEDSFWRLRSGN